KNKYSILRMDGLMRKVPPIHQEGLSVGPKYCRLGGEQRERTRIESSRMTKMQPSIGSIGLNHVREVWHRACRPRTCARPALRLSIWWPQNRVLSRPSCQHPPG